MNVFSYVFILAYGLLAWVALLVGAAVFGDSIDIGLVALGIGCTYVFQVIDALTNGRGGSKAFWIGAVGIWAVTLTRIVF